MIKKIFTLLLALAATAAAPATTPAAVAATAAATAAGSECYAYLRNDTLLIGNSLLERTFLWNGGNLITHSLTDKTARYTHQTRTSTPDFQIADHDAVPTAATFAVRHVAENGLHPPCLEATVQCSLHGVDVQRTYRIYRHVAAIACHTRLKGRADALRGAKTDLRLDRFSPGGRHWKIRAVEFYDATDRNNNLVFERNALSSHRESYRGNLLFAHDETTDHGCFFLKESPVPSAQPAYPGSDFTTDPGCFALTAGIDANDLSENEWTSAYTAVLGLYTGREQQALVALRTYRKALRTFLPHRDEMIMINTWGDRNRDAKINQSFILAELERAARLGITHFQIDDGWQTGKSPNSATAHGSFENIWDGDDYWTPDPVKFPDGLAPIIRKGKTLHLEICLWFNPSMRNDCADWRKDAQTLIHLYRRYGIRTFKIDGLDLASRRAEANIRKMFDTVLEATRYEAIFNLDATAGRRAGYHMFNEYGNIFLENRYTDFQNYYPYQTLRNLWQLARYVPAERLQIEFLNKWRNADAYGDDPFAPSRYGFDYLFAVTMAGQPLAWLESTQLPEEAMTIGSLVEEYKKIRHDFHAGIILPIGNEPSGKSWTGFQSMNGSRGYFLVFRENTPHPTGFVETWLPEGATLRCTPLLGYGRAFNARVGRKGVVKVELPDVNTFAMYAYETIQQ
jgi:hypothetical protein